jgi:hypothetical protein
MRYGRTPSSKVTHLMHLGSIVTLCGVWLDDISALMPPEPICKSCMKAQKARP